jgi:hypothetical protein
MTTSNQKRADICKRFLRLPSTALPSAILIDDDEGDAWETVRTLARGERPGLEVGLADELRLRADADGWREGVILGVDE